MAALPEFDKFDLNAENQASLGIQWKRWTNRLENFFVAVKIIDEVRWNHRQQNGFRLLSWSQR